MSVHDGLGQCFQVGLVARVVGVGIQVHAIDGIDPDQFYERLEDTSPACPL